ncbi:MAG: D-alanyl-D-alanine carboxypeptidase [Actinomycetota bacterium]|nr:D-alanyl-D-alanine carboxypeptidase [Actinomycetota bacterium]
MTYCLLPSGKVYAQTSHRITTSSNIDTVATSAIVQDYNTGKIYWEKNPDELMYPASTTKIITAIIAIENIEDLNQKIQISKNASGSNNSRLSFKRGDKITLMDLLKAALIESTNNATVALAEYVSGNVDDFVGLMNIKAQEIGAFNTKFENTNGLDSKYPSHKTTARDLLKITAYCLKNDLFKEIISMEKTTININDKEIELNNTNTLLSYDYIKGVKTGYTKNAGYCLITYSNKNNIELISVVLNSSPYGRNYDSLRIINWVYDNFTEKKVIDSEFPVLRIAAKDEYSSVYFDLYPEKDLNMIINDSEDKIYYNYIINDDVLFPVKAETSYGKLIVYVNKDRVGEIDLLSKDSIESPLMIQEISKTNDMNQLRIPLILIISFYFLIFTIIIVKNFVRTKFDY